MQAQASLKEAESARLMNLILLPFTIVTVIFVSLAIFLSPRTPSVPLIA